MKRKKYSDIKNNIVNMLLSSKNSKINIKTNDDNDTKVSQLFKNISDCANKSPPRHKYEHIMPIVPLYTYNEAKRLNLNIGSKCWATASKIYSKTNDVTAKISYKSKPSLDPIKKQQIRDHCILWSRVSPYRTLKRVRTNNKPTNVRFLLCSKAQLWREFLKQNKNTTAKKTTFLKNIPPEFKPAKRDQDKCDDCYQLKIKIRNVRKELKLKLTNCGCLRVENINPNDIEYELSKDDYYLNYNYQDIINSCIHLTDNEKTEWNSELLISKELQYHRELSHSQRAAYREQIQTCQMQLNKLLMVFDWKENYTFKGGCVATGRDFYEYVSASIMGVVFFCLNINNGNPIYIPIVSNVLTHDGTTAIMNINKAIDKVNSEYNNVFEMIDTLYAWGDSGSHYRNKEVAYFILHELVIKYKFDCILNFFGGKHGKNHCDNCFGHISGFLSNAEQSIRVDSLKKIVEVIQHSQQSINDNIDNNNDKTVILPVEWSISEDEVQLYKGIHKKMDIDGISAFHCFKTKKSNLRHRHNHIKIVYVHGLSNNQRCKAVHWKIGSVVRKNDPKKNPDKDINRNKIDFGTLAAANNKLRLLLKELSINDNDETGLSSQQRGDQKDMNILQQLFGYSNS